MMKTHLTFLAGLSLIASPLEAGDAFLDSADSAKAVEFEEPTPVISPYFTYLFDYFHNTTGGFQTGGAAMGLFDVGAEVDLEQLFGWKGATFVVSAFAGHGSDFSANFVGDFGVVSNLYADTNFNIYHLYFEQALEGESFFRIGQFAIDDDFMATDSSALFLGSPFLPLNTQSANMPGPIFPLAAPGAQYYHSPTGEWYVVTGVFVGDAGPGGPRDRGFEWRWGGGAGFSLFSEGGVIYNEDGGVVKVGGYYYSGDVTQFATGNTVDGLGAVYGMVDHPIIPTANGSTGLSAFLRGSISGNEDRVTATSQVDGGLVFQNVFCAEDSLGFAASHTTFGDDYLRATPGVTSSETVIEATYRVPITENFAIQPDVQYVLNPHESGRDAVAVGIRGEISF
ncbi:MAG: carbohydrate porin [Verrucomicrobiota bacterium]